MESIVGHFVEAYVFERQNHKNISCISQSSSLQELFIEKLVKDLSEEHGENITYDELSQYILGNDDLDYLHCM